MAAGAVALAIGLRFVAGALMPSPPPFMTFFPAILFATLVAGGRGGLLALAASLAAVLVFFLPPGRPLDTLAVEHVQVAMFAVTGALMILIAKLVRIRMLHGVSAEERFRAAQEGALDAFVILDPIRRGGEVIDFRWVYANPAADGMAPNGVETLTGRTVRETFPPAQADELVRRFCAIQGRRETAEQLNSIVIDGQTRWLRSSAVRIRDGVALTSRDVTEERRSELALRAAELDARRNQARFEHIANAVPVMIWMSGPDNRRDWFNQRWLDFAGRDADAEAGDGWLSRVHPDDLERVLSVSREALAAQQPYQLEYRQRRHDGAWRWIDGEARPRYGPDGAFLGYIGSCTDITERREAEQERRVTEARSRAFVEALPQLMWTARADGWCEYLSPQWYYYTGVHPREHRGDGWLEAIHPEDRDDVERAWGQMVAGALPFDLEFRVRRHDGAWRWFSGRASPQRDESGNVLRWFGSATDITEIVEARRDLEARVAERTRELEASLEERAHAEAALAQAQRLETVGRLTGGVAHDFNNLLTVVIGGLDMILRSPEDTARVKRLAEAALAAGRRGERLTRQLLAFSRRQELKLEVVDVPGLIAQVEPLVRRAAGEAVELEVSCAPDVRAARLDAAQFEAAVLNLVVNAVDAATGPARIEIAAARAEVKPGELRNVRAGRYVRVSVADNGAGMPPEVLERVFEPFFTTKEVGKGTGLGLAQVYGFVTQCGGGVAIDSAPGQGTTVSLYLPEVDETPRAEPAEKPAASAAWLRDLKVLLVEDDAGVRAVTEGLLVDFGCKVACDPDGPSALKRLRGGERFNLMISDIVMPGGMSGVELARAAQDGDADLPIVLTTGYSGEQAGGSPLDLEWPVLRKPFRGDQLAATLRQALESHRQPQEA